MSNLVNSTIENTYTYHTDPALITINKIQKKKYYENAALKHQIQYTYNSSGFVSETVETITGKGVYTSAYTYDTENHIIREDYPNISLSNLYDIHGNLLEKTYQSGSNWEPLWKLEEAFHDSRIKRVTLGNGITSEFEFNTTDWSLSRIHAYNNTGSITDFRIQRDLNLSNGNIESIEHSGVTERYKYDNLDRLISFRTFEIGVTSNEILREMEYSSNGNLQYKYDAGEFEYTLRPFSPHTTTYSITSPVTNNTLSEAQDITYNHLNKITTLVQASKKLNIAYGIEGQRLSTTVSESQSVIYQADYIGTANMEVLNGDEVTYIYVNNQPVAMHRKNANDLYYFHLDVMGSLVAISNAAGNVVEERSYDPWGRPRNPATLNYTLPNPFGGLASSYTLRGFTFHEHLDWFDLINMNGRMYDTHLSQFINADPVLADAENGQNYNRYSYVLNNPLKYTDPTGYVYGNFGNGGTPGSVIGANRHASLEYWNNQINYQYSGQTLGEMFGDLLMSRCGASVTPTIEYTHTKSGSIEGTISEVVVSAKRIHWVSLNSTSNYFGPYYQTNWTNNSNSQQGASSRGGDRNLSDPKQYPGISIYQNTDKSDMTAVTLPGFGIYIGGGYSGRSLTCVMQHEYGHYLDYRFSSDINFPGQIPMANFYLGIGVPSLFNAATGIGGSHSSYWTEIRANQWAEIWFGKNLDPDFLKLYPTK